MSESKAFVYGVVLDAVGAAATEDRVDREPWGDASNEISLDPVTSKPMDAMINAGAIAVTGLVPGTDLDERFAWLLERMSALAGGTLRFDEAVEAVSWLSGPERLVEPGRDAGTRQGPHLA